MVTSGLLYSYVNELQAVGLPLSMGIVALVHTLGAFLLIAFVIGHIYLTTTGDSPLSNVKAMITGWEEIEMADNEPGRLVS